MTKKKLIVFSNPSHWGSCMKKRKQFALNKLFNLCVILGLLLAWVSIDFFIDGDIYLGIGFGVAALPFIILPALFTPYCYTFDSEGVSLCYVFFPTERYLWKNIYAIEATDKETTVKVSLIDFFYRYVFSISGTNEGETRFYMDGHIRKSFRTKYLIEKYWDGTIDGLMLRDFKNWIKKHKLKRQQEIKVHLTDEIVPMEQEIRTKMRELINPLIAEAKLYNLDLKANYYYITENFEETLSRPKESYTYTLIIKISHFGETNEDRIITASVDLLYVRLGKTAYRGVVNKYIDEEFKAYICETLNEIYKNGIEVYCKEN